ncbi:homoserine dehydrogenase [Solibacillus sp. R5-41]|uniref:homoserine dehydrogenase n=1 Tax=Solibacillus sp. R5-41 TaxID=2048654 RepID=UPI000C12643C|nr:homoserine dehydrogenase [Solibacillus sp. R5-41]ATP39811.1 homoserine dehydrogenase [Solibacillus sp. R5-41]
MQKNKYRIHSNALFEIAQSRAFTEKDNIEERFDETGKIKLVSDRAGADLLLFLVKTEDGLSYLVKWDDSEEFYKGFNMAWEEFLWCLDIINKPLEEAAKKAAIEAAEAAKKAAEEAALAATEEAAAEEQKSQPDEDKEDKEEVTN